nr:hypothetical protein [Corynebacterium lactis]
MGPTVGKSDLGSAIYGTGTDAGFTVTEESAKAAGGAADDVVRAARWGGRATGSLGGVFKAEIDRRSGMDPVEAYATNGIGVAAGAIAGGAAIAGATALAPPVAATVAAGVGVGAIVGFGVTKGLQAAINYFCREANES